MRVTQWGEYAIHCAVMLAGHKGEGDSGGAVPAADIAAQQGIAIDYAQQILQRLRKANLITSVRGPTGGYRLSRPAHEISLHDLLFAAEGDTFEVICDNKPLNSSRCAPGALCNLRPLWFSLREHVNNFLREYTLQDVIDGKFSEMISSTLDKPVTIGASREHGQAS